MLDVLRAMGGTTEVEIHRSALGEPEGDLCRAFAPLRGATMGGETLARAAAELPLIVAMAARARGVSEISDLRAVLGAQDFEEMTRRWVSILGDFGVPAETRDDALVIEGRADGVLMSADIDTQDDPGDAALATVLALVAEGPTRIRRVDGLARRFPRFVGTLRALGVAARVEERTV
jgi:3-phosphoshikimate 1-carboxyvinyltransferase